MHVVNLCFLSSAEDEDALADVEPKELLATVVECLALLGKLPHAVEVSFLYTCYSIFINLKKMKK